MKKLFQFVKKYKLFSLALIALIASLILLALGQKTAVNWVLGTVSIVAVIPLLWHMWQDVRHGTYGIDILAATAIISAVLLHEYWAAIVVVLMLTGGESLEDYAQHRAQAELHDLLSRAPQKAHVLRKGKIVDVKVADLHEGDKIIIKPGEVVPVDALILEGVASFDESSLTGESLPQSKQLGDKLLSGSINLDGAITAKATATAENSQYQQIVKLVRGAANAQAPFVRLADRYALPFTLFAYALAVTAWVVGGQPIRFLEVIVVATPCPLLLAAPIALISGMARASKYGIIVKTGTALEKLAESATIAFDKTGTLTRGRLRVSSIKVYGAFEESEVLATAASLEQKSNHILASAIVEAASEQKIKLLKVKQVQEISGRGLLAFVKGEQILVGRLSLLEENQVKLPAKFSIASIQQTAAYVAIDGVLAGVILLEDELRPEAKATLARLHTLGVKNTLMMTGDNQTTANAIAKQIGIDTVYAEMLPADKLHALAKIKTRPIAFVGDGVNDAPVLTAADVGIALGAKGSTAASESADMVIMLDDVSRVAIAVHIARRTFQIARQSILIGIAMSVGLMIVFSTGKFSPLLGALLQEIVDVFVIFNALRAHVIAVEEI